MQLKQKDLCTFSKDLYGEDAVTDQKCQKWFAKFRAGDSSLDEAPWSGRPVEVDSDQTKTLRTVNIIEGDSQHDQNIQIKSYW